ncbi:MAG TPA: hypothetical protein VFZ29_09865 [Solirubrobacterales bacterium]
MADCFCGCGRKVKFGSRGMNRNGAGTVSLVRQLEETRAALEERGPLRPTGDNGPILATYDQRIEDGLAYADAWTDAVHNNGVDVGPRSAFAFKREWNSWGKDAQEFDGLIRRLLVLPPDQLDQVLDELYPTS